MPSSGLCSVFHRPAECLVYRRPSSHLRRFSRALGLADRRALRRPGAQRRFDPSPSIAKIVGRLRANRFDVVVAEALDRLSRDQEDIAGLYKRLQFQGIKLVTCSEGEISELHVGLKGTMNALFLREPRGKTYRGLEGRIRKGRSAGGLTFGYDIVTGDRSRNDERGSREINSSQAAIVERIFSDFAAGKSPVAIARH